MTCYDCRYYNPDTDHECDKYPAILPIDGADICASFKPAEISVTDCDPVSIPWQGEKQDVEYINGSWDEISK